METLLKRTPGLYTTYRKYREFSASSELREAAFAREKYERDRRSEILRAENVGREEGRAEGWEEGHAEGREEGLIKGQEKMLHSLWDMKFGSQSLPDFQSKLEAVMRESSDSERLAEIQKQILVYESPEEVLRRI